MELCLHTITSPELLHSYETLLTLGFKTVKARLDFAAERTEEWEQAAPAMGEREGVEMAGGAWWLLTPFLPLPRNCCPTGALLGSQFPLWQSTNMLHTLKFRKAVFVCPLQWISSPEAPIAGSLLP